MRQFARFSLGILLLLAACVGPTVTPTATPGPTPTNTRIPFTPRPTITPLPFKIWGQWPENWRLLIIDRRGALLRVDPLSTEKTIDAQRNFEKPTVHLALSADHKRVFVTQFTNEPGEDVVEVLELESGATIGMIPAADGTNFIYPLPDGNLLAGSKYAGLMQVIDPDSLTITRTYDLGVTGTATSGADNFLVASDGLVYVPLGKHERSIAVLDPQSGDVRYLPQEGQPYMRAVILSPDGKTLLALDADGEQLLAIDKTSGEKLNEIPLCGGANALAASPDGQKAYVYCPKDHGLAVVDVTTQSLINIVDLGMFGLGAWVSVDPTGQFVYAGGFGVVFILDGKTDELLAAIPMHYRVPGMFGLTRIELP